MRQRHYAARLAVPVSGHDHVRGRADAPVTLVEYGDDECPACGAAYPVVAARRGQWADRLRFVFRNFPLSSVHPHAGDAALAAEALGLDADRFEDDRQGRRAPGGSGKTSSAAPAAA